MNFQFCFNGTPIEPHEAVALLEASSSKATSSKPIIELNNLIDSKNLDAGKLFELAVTKQNQGLASLAWKISVQQKQSPATGVRTFSPKLNVVNVTSKHDNLEDIIDHLNKTSNYCSLGVAMLLTSTSNKEWVTIRETAMYFANEVVSAKLRLFNSKFLKGFEWDGEKYAPLDLSSGIERKNTFHVSPLYIALREGLVYCKEHNLVEQKKMLSVGAPYSKNTSPSISSTRRLYYKIKASQRGQDLIKLWADLDRYIEKHLVSQAAN